VITKGVHLVGDVMADALAFNAGLHGEYPGSLKRPGLEGRSIAL